MSLIAPTSLSGADIRPAGALSGVTLAGVPRGSAMTSVLSFNSRDSLGVIRLVRFPGVLILGLSLL
jgi:hypothetical protein